MTHLYPEAEITLQGLIDHLCGIYGSRNALFYPERQRRIAFIGSSIGRLEDAYRKNQGRERQSLIQKGLARTTARLLCFTDSLPNVNFVEIFSTKYGYDMCLYCQKPQCECRENRESARLCDPKKECLNWSLTDWRAHLKTLYGERNNKQQPLQLILRLYREVFELSELAWRNWPTDTAVAGIERQYALEWSDTLAWVIAVANHFDVDLEAAVKFRYGQGCHRCMEPVCQCGNRH